jgi:hypothetical protein
MNNPIRNIDPDGQDAISEDAVLAWGHEKSAEAVNRALGKESDSNGSNWASKGPYKVHQEANANGINRTGESKDAKETALRKRETNALNKGTEWADANNHQTAEYDYMHAMTDKDADRSKSIQQANDFVRATYAKAQQALSQGNIDRAYELLGIAIHPLQDATSPAHAGFQIWTGHEDAMIEAAHVGLETTYPGENSNLQKVTNYYINLFQNNQPLPTGNLFKNIQSDPAPRDRDVGPYNRLPGG